MEKYSFLKSGSVFHSHRNKLVEDVIQWAVTKGKPTKNTPNHSGFILRIHGQMMVAEVQLGGFKLDSLDKYYKKDNYLVAVFEPLLREEQFGDLENLISFKLRKDFDRKYDFSGAIGSAPWFKNIFKEKPRKQFCSEVVYLLTSTIGMVYPPAFTHKTPPNPLALMEYQAADTRQWRRI
jgi:hypothetical protein